MNPELIALARQVANKRQVPPDQVVAIMEVYGDGKHLISSRSVDVSIQIEKVAREMSLPRNKVERLLLKLGENNQIPNFQYLERYATWAKTMKFEAVKERHQFVYCCAFGLGFIPVKDILMPEMIFYPDKHLKYLRQYCRNPRSQIEKICGIVEACHVRTSLIESMNNVAAYKRGLSYTVNSILPETYLLVNAARSGTQAIQEQLVGVIIDESNMEDPEE